VLLRAGILVLVQRVLRLCKACNSHLYSVYFAFVQRVLRREELVQTHLEGLNCLVRAEDWILGCLLERLQQIRVPSSSPPAPARRDMMRKECGASGKRAAPGEGWRAELCEL
jgi:hypothetical protein